MDDRQRFEDAYRDHSTTVVAYVARRTDPTTAADVVAETFAVAWRRVRDLPDSDGQRAWFVAIARNVLANMRRSERRRVRLVNRASSELERTIREMVSHHTIADVGLDGSLVAALDSLDTDDRELLTLLAWDGLTRTEISEVLGCTKEALRTRIHRARVRFRRALDQLHEQPIGPPEPSSNGAHDDNAVPTTRSLNNV